MQDETPPLMTTTDEEQKPFPTTLVLAICWAILGTALWAFGLLTIGFGWIIAPLLYVGHMGLQVATLKKVVKEQMTAIVDEVMVEGPGDYTVVSFEDASKMKGVLN